MKIQSLLSGKAAMGATSIALAFAAAPASANVVTFDFGTIGSGGGAPCASDCVLPGTSENFFTTGGVSIGAIGYNHSGAVAYVTQKPGAFMAHGGETGLGESDTYPHTSDSDYEITTSTWLLIDNSSALAHGYDIKSISLESIQNGEGAKIYSYTGSLSALNFASLHLIDTISAPATGGVTQTVSVPAFSQYLVIQAFEPTHGSAGADVLLAQEVIATPEPATWSLMLIGFGALGGAVRRRRLTHTS